MTTQLEACVPSKLRRLRQFATNIESIYFYCANDLNINIKGYSCSPYELNLFTSYLRWNAENNAMILWFPLNLSGTKNLSVTLLSIIPMNALLLSLMGIDLGAGGGETSGPMTGVSLYLVHKRYMFIQGVLCYA